MPSNTGFAKVLINGHFFAKMAYIMKRIKIKIGDLALTAGLNGSTTAGKIWDALPIKSKTSTWGDEIYFPIPVKIKREDGFSQEIVEIGDLGYWPEGNCFCVFFGATPISKPGEIRPASSVNVFGRLESDFEALKEVKEDEEIVIEMLD